MDWVAIGLMAMLVVFTYIPETVLFSWPKRRLKLFAALYWAAIIFVVVYCGYLAWGYYTDPAQFIQR